MLIGAVAVLAFIALALLVAIWRRQSDAEPLEALDRSRREIERENRAAIADPKRKVRRLYPH